MNSDLFDVLGMKSVETRETKKEAKKDTVVSKSKNDTEEKSSSKKYAYPFKIHFGGETRDVDHIFTEGVEYTEAEIKEAMLNHQFYEFSGEVAFDYRDKDNVLIPIFKHHKKG